MSETIIITEPDGTTVEVSGPSGPQGPDGADGTFGTDRGVWTAGTYYADEVVTYNGSVYKATSTTTGTPGVAAAWVLRISKGDPGATGAAGVVAATAPATYNSGTQTIGVTVGTTTNTLAAGDDGRITGAAAKANNLSDLASASTARTNLGLGTAATSASGDFATSGHSHAAYAEKAGATFTGEVVTPASTTGAAGLNVPHGAAPTSPVNGDVWSTTAGFYVRVNGTTVGPLSTGGGGGGDLLAANNLSDLALASTARTNLGLGTAAVVNTGTGASNVILGNDARLTDTRTPSSTLAHKTSHATGGSDALTASDIGAAATSHTHANTDITGLGGAAVLSVGTTTGTVAAGDDSRITGAAAKASNLSDLASASTARTNLGLGTAAVAATGDFDAAGAASTAQSAAISAAAALVDDLSGVSSASTARTNLGLGGAAVLAVGTTAGTVAAGDHTHAIDGLLPTQTGNTGKYLTTNGSAASWATVAGGGSAADDESLIIASRMFS